MWEKLFESEINTNTNAANANPLIDEIIKIKNTHKFTHHRINRPWGSYKSYFKKKEIIDINENNDINSNLS